MPRLVQRTRGKPYAVTIGGKTEFICACGLSRNQPRCDGAHKVTQTEESAKLYWYDATGARHDVVGSYPDIQSEHTAGF